MCQRLGIGQRGRREDLVLDGKKEIGPVRAKKPKQLAQGAVQYSEAKPIADMPKRQREQVLSCIVEINDAAGDKNASGDAEQSNGGHCRGHDSKYVADDWVMTNHFHGELQHGEAEETLKDITAGNRDAHG